jgi:hypothetical protein
MFNGAIIKNIKMYLKSIQNVHHYVQLRQLAGITLIMGTTNKMFSLSHQRIFRDTRYYILS